MLQHFSKEELESLQSNWRFWARDSQIPPPDEDDWFAWLILAGRGFGKTWVGANVTNEVARTGKASNIALVGRDAHDVRAYMIEGESGILAQAPKDFIPEYFPSKRILEYPNGVTAHIYYAESPQSIRGPNHGFAWCDEPASWQDAHLGIAEDTAWSNLMFTMRKGDPKVIITGTPKPVKLIRQIMKMRSTMVTRGSTYENRANLAKRFYDSVVGQYEGTRLGRQEIEGELLDDNPAALWTRECISDNRVSEYDFDIDAMDAIVVAVDPQASGVLEDEMGEATDTSAKEGAETGIIVVGKKDEHRYVIADKSVKGNPDVWAQAVIDAFLYYRADKIIVEKNNGGEMVAAVIKAQARGLPEEERICDAIGTVWASRGKQTRAEPISTQYQKNKWHHVGIHLALEDQMCYWDPSVKKSPDRMDALVWAGTHFLDDQIGFKEGDAEDFDTFYRRG